MNDFKISICMGNTPFVTGYNIVGVIQTFILLSFLFSLVTFFFLLLPQTTTWVYQSKLSKLENITLILQSKPLQYNNYRLE